MEQNEQEQITQKKTFNDVKKDDPYKVYEQLQLTLEEVCQDLIHNYGKWQIAIQPVPETFDQTFSYSSWHKSRI